MGINDRLSTILTQHAGEMAFVQRSQIIRRLLFPGLVIVGLVACVTTEGRVFTAEASPEQALQQRLQLARSYIGAQNREAAKRNLAIAAEIDSDAPEVHEAFALVYQSTGEFELSEKSFKRALSLNRDFSRARNNYAAFLYQRQRYVEAKKQLEIVVKDPFYESRARAYLNLGLCRLRLEDQEGAAAAFTRTLAMDRTNRIALLELSQIEYARSNWSAAQRHYGIYRTLVSRQSARGLWLGLQLAAAQGDRDAQASYDLALRNLFPDSPQYKLYLEAMDRGEL